VDRWSLEIASVASTTPVDLRESPGVIIPDAPDSGIERSLSTASTMRVGSVELSVDISHTWIGDLQVSLVSPAGTAVMLHDRTGGSSDNLVRTYTAATTPALANLASQPVAGTWKLKVADREAQDVGKLNDWRLLIRP
jgi:subtilisin-like proprotein convertase family protein